MKDGYYDREFRLAWDLVIVIYKHWKKNFLFILLYFGFESNSDGGKAIYLEINIDDPWNLSILYWKGDWID